MQQIDNGFKEFDQLWIAIPEFIKRARLLLEYCEYSIWRMASLDDGGKWVTKEILPCAFLVLVQGGVKEGFKVRQSGCCAGSWGHGVIGGIWDVVGGTDSSAQRSTISVTVRSVPGKWYACPGFRQ